ncbi:MAG TPA: hypothetical protein VG937_10225 [Polyangiaceae bacterium]|nr:hypothetical protein [Polyangiaceae bacterium]
MRYRTKPQSILWLSALIAVGACSWACSSSSSNDAGSSKGGNSSASGGRTGTSGTTSGADAGQGNDAGENGNPGNGGSSTGAGGKATAGGSSTSAGGSANAGSSSTGTTACDNGKDDDGDGLIDGFDPECTGPLDNDEGTFATGIPGDNKDPKWQDCFFDGNSGAGDDSCRYATGCLTGELAQDDPDCVVSDTCIKFCARLTQNGCDCFGCCTVQLPDGSTVDVSTAATCSVANVADEKACPRCTKNTQCGNTCGECELCAGKTLSDLPASCTPPKGTGGAPSSGGATGKGGTTGNGGTAQGGVGGTTGGVTQTCDSGEQICGPGHAACPDAQYCSFGCCIPAIR